MNFLHKAENLLTRVMVRVRSGKTTAVDDNSMVSRWLSTQKKRFRAEKLRFDHLVVRK